MTFRCFLYVYRPCYCSPRSNAWLLILILLVWSSKVIALTDSFLLLTDLLICHSVAAYTFYGRSVHLQNPYYPGDRRQFKTAVQIFNISFGT